MRLGNFSNVKVSMALSSAAKDVSAKNRPSKRKINFVKVFFFIYLFCIIFRKSTGTTVSGKFFAISFAAAIVYFSTKRGSSFFR